jgi:hypothetical protein
VVFRRSKIGGRLNTKARRGREISALQRVDGHRNRVVFQAKRKRGIQARDQVQRNHSLFIAMYLMKTDLLLVSWESNLDQKLRF